MDTPTTEINQETNLIGTVTSNLTATGLLVTATFIDKVTGNPRAPQTNTLEYTLDQNNSSSETILADSVSTVNGITTITINTAGRNIPKFGTGAGSGTGISHVIGAAIGCVDIARPLNLLAQIANQKANIDGQVFTGPVSITGTSSYFGLPQLTTTQRDALVSPQNGWEIFNTTTGTKQSYIGGVWVDDASGSTPFAAPGIAGKVETGTLAQQAAHTSVGASGALLVPQIGNLLTVSAGAGSAGAIFVAGSNGKFDPSTSDAISGTLLTAKGGLITATASDTPVQLAVGSDGQVLIADSSQTDGIKWGQVPLATGNFANGTATRVISAATGTQVITHGLNILPKKIRIFVTFAGGGTSSTIVNVTSDGSWNGAGTDTCCYSFLDGTAAGGGSGIDTVVAHCSTADAAFSGGATTQKATISATSTTTFTLSWVLTGSNPAGANLNIHWEVTV